MKRMHEIMKNLFTEITSIILVVIGFATLLIGLIFFLSNDCQFDITQKIDADKWGQFGEFIGGVTGSIWALASVILFYVALRAQKEDSKNQQQILQEQSDIFKTQQFESTFFNSIDLLNNIISDITYKNPPSYVNPDSKFAKIIGNHEEGNGRDCFKLFYKNFKNEYSILIDSHSTNLMRETGIIGLKISIPLDTQVTYVKEAYKKFFEKYESNLGHYFRTLYNIVKFVDDQCPMEERKKYYTNLLRAQLSTYEHLLLFYNSLSVDGIKFKDFIEKYHMLDNISKTNLLDSEHEKLYSETAYL